MSKESLKSRKVKSTGVSSSSGIVISSQGSQVGQVWFILGSQSSFPSSAQKPTTLSQGFSQRSIQGLLFCSFPYCHYCFFWRFVTFVFLPSLAASAILHDLSKMMMTCNDTSQPSLLGPLGKPYLLPWTCMHLGFPRDAVACHFQEFLLSLTITARHKGLGDLVCEEGIAQPYLHLLPLIDLLHSVVGWAWRPPDAPDNDFSPLILPDIS